MNSRNAAIVGVALVVLAAVATPAGAVNVTGTVTDWAGVPLPGRNVHVDAHRYQQEYDGQMGQDGVGWDAYWCSETFSYTGTAVTDGSGNFTIPVAMPEPLPNPPCRSYTCNYYANGGQSCTDEVFFHTDILVTLDAANYADAKRCDSAATCAGLLLRGPALAGGSSAYDSHRIGLAGSAPVGASGGKRGAVVFIGGFDPTGTSGPGFYKDVLSRTQMGNGQNFLQFVASLGLELWLELPGKNSSGDLVAIAQDLKSDLYALASAGGTTSCTPQPQFPQPPPQAYPTPLVVLGYSQGGLQGKLVVNQMCPTAGPACPVKLFGALDSPLAGASVPYALLMMLRDPNLAQVLSSAGASFGAAEVLNAPSVAQMLPAIPNAGCYTGCINWHGDMAGFVFDSCSSDDDSFGSYFDLHSLDWTPHWGCLGNTAAFDAYQAAMGGPPAVPSIAFSMGKDDPFTFTDDDNPEFTATDWKEMLFLNQHSWSWANLVVPEAHVHLRLIDPGRPFPADHAGGGSMFNIWDEQKPVGLVGHYKVQGEAVNMDIAAEHSFHFIPWESALHGKDDGVWLDWGDNTVNADHQPRIYNAGAPNNFQSTGLPTHLASMIGAHILDRMSGDADGLPVCIDDNAAFLQPIQADCEPPAAEIEGDCVDNDGDGGVDEGLVLWPWPPDDELVCGDERCTTQVARCLDERCSNLCADATCTSITAAAVTCSGVESGCNAVRDARAGSSTVTYVR